MVLSRRVLLGIPIGFACSRPPGGYRGYAFVANQEGQAVAAVDLEVMAVARHIPLDSAPSQVVAAQERPAVYALTPSTGSVHEIQVYKLNAGRKVQAASSAVSMQLGPGEKSLYVLARDPRALISVSLESLRTEWSVRLPEDPVEFAISPEGNKVAITTGSGVWLLDLAARGLTGPLGRGEFGSVMFRGDGKLLLAANRSDRVLSAFDPESGRLMVHLPVAVRPDNLCVSRDGGQLFITGDGMDGVVIAYPYQVEIARTVLAGRAPGAMAASDALLYVTSPQAGDVSILGLGDYKLAAVIPVGADPGFVTITPDSRYALELNRKSGDLTVMLRNRYGAPAVLTVIPVGSRPVSAAVRGI